MAPEQSLASGSIAIRNLFRRCVQCPTGTPDCPSSCPSGEICQLVSQSCDACAHTVCTKIGSLPGQLPAEQESTPIGPIVGGVIGGIVGLAILAFLVWWFYIRPKRRQMAWENEKRATLRAADRQSTHSRRSVASTVMTRASNVIQIAYIPGVTVRSPPESPGFNAPPMPPLPGNVSAAQNSGTDPEQHFFMPSDLRASTWSDTSTMNPRISLSPSLARTTYYGGEAEVIPPVPAQQAFRAQANMVSVKSGNNTPAMPSTQSPAIQQRSRMENSSIVAKNVVARPIEIKKSGSAPRVPTLGNLAKESASPKPESTTSEKSIPVFFDEKEVHSPVESEKEVVSPIDSSYDIYSIRPKPSFATGSSGRSSSVSGISRIMPSEGALAGGSSTVNHRYSKSEGLNAMIEQALKNAAGSKVTRPELKTQDSGPFSDAHEL